MDTQGTREWTCPALIRQGRRRSPSAQWPEERCSARQPRPKSFLRVRAEEPGKPSSSPSRPSMPNVSAQWFVSYLYIEYAPILSEQKETNGSRGTLLHLRVLDVYSLSICTAAVLCLADPRSPRHDCPDVCFAVPYQECTRPDIGYRKIVQGDLHVRTYELEDPGNKDTITDPTSQQPVQGMHWRP